MLRRLLVPTLAALLAAAATTAVAIGGTGSPKKHSRPDTTYAVGLWGDLPYSTLQATVGVPNLIADMNRRSSPSASTTATSRPARASARTPSTRRGSPTSTASGHRRRSPRATTTGRTATGPPAPRHWSASTTSGRASSRRRSPRASTGCANRCSRCRSASALRGPHRASRTAAGRIAASRTRR